MATQIMEKLTMEELASQTRTLAKAGKQSCEEFSGLIMYNGRPLWARKSIQKRVRVKSRTLKKISCKIKYDIPHQRDQPIAFAPKSLQSSLASSWILSILWLCSRNYLCCVFKSNQAPLSEHRACVLTEHKTLCRIELVLTDTSSHQIYTCTYSETTTELIGRSFIHIIWTL